MQINIFSVFWISQFISFNFYEFKKPLFSKIDLIYFCFNYFEHIVKEVRQIVLKLSVYLCHFVCHRFSAEESQK